MSHDPRDVILLNRARCPHNVCFRSLTQICGCRTLMMGQVSVYKGIRTDKTEHGSRSRISTIGANQQKICLLSLSSVGGRCVSINNSNEHIKLMNKLFKENNYRQSSFRSQYAKKQIFIGCSRPEPLVHPFTCLLRLPSIKYLTILGPNGLILRGTFPV